MELTKFIDSFGDDVFALALIVTKDFNSAKQVFLSTCKKCGDYDDDCNISQLAADTYSLCEQTENNDDAMTLTGIELDTKRLAVLETVLQKPQKIRSAIHLFYESDLSEKEIAEITGESEKYIKGVLSELSEELKLSLDKYYKEICFKIRAEDKLKQYAVRCAAVPQNRAFEVREEAVAKHSWSRNQKIIVIVAAIIVTFAVCFIIPIMEKYFDMLEDEQGYSYEVPATDEIFSYTVESE